MKMLVVASPTLEVLSTAGPIPTDGQPEWVRCRLEGCGRWPAESAHGWNPDPDELDGPFPFRVAVWQEVERTCPPWHYLPGPYSASDCEFVHLHRSMRKGGAVVATVEVGGTGHQADECATSWPPGTRQMGPCRPVALPDCWHTPTGEVTRLAVPIPMERPPADRIDESTARTHYWALHGGLAPTDLLTAPAPWWWADLDLEVARV